MTADRVQSVERAVQVLLAFEDLDAHPTISGLAAELGVHKSTVSRIVATLVDLDMVGLDEHQRLTLGPATRRLAAAAYDQPDLVELAQPILDELAAETDETATLSIPYGSTVVTVAQGAARHLVSANSWVGLRAPAHATSDGKVLLACGAIMLADTLLRRCTPATIVNRARLLDELGQAHARGWASSTGEFEVGLNGVAAPVLDGRGRCRAAVCVAGPEYRVTTDRLAHLARSCQRAAQSLIDLPGAATAFATHHPRVEETIAS